MRYGQGIAVLTLFTLLSCCSFKSLLAGEEVPFKVEVNFDNINIRTDSTVSSGVISSVSKGQQLEVVSELYDWYKIRLPKGVPSFIKKSLTGTIEDKPSDSFNKLKNSTPEQKRIAKVAADRVNIRLAPNESSAILGVAAKNEVVTVLADKGGWLKIEPINNSFGWINKKFVAKVTVSKKPEEDGQGKKDEQADNGITVEGVIRPYGMIFKRVATHKLITSGNDIFLLKGDKKSLDALNYHKVKVSGKLIKPGNERFPVIEINKIEGLD